MRQFLMLLVIWLAWLPASASFLVAESAQTPESLKGQDIAGLIRQLGSDSFQDREEAQRKLLQLGKAAKKQLEGASKGTDAEVARRAVAVLGALREQDAGRAEVHIIGLYESRGRKAVVEVRETKKPVILVLCAYESVTWSVQASEGAEILQVIASGYHRQLVEGTKAPITTYSYDEGSRAADGRPFFFFTSDHDEERYPDVVAKVRQLTGKKPTSFQGRYSFKKVPFVIGGED